ncbi:MAG: hypothetical protein RL563_2230 [Pseudomonadota bacterium]|jgi:outer membrane receptor for monomeric catechols
MTALYQLSANYIAAMDFLTDPENDIDTQTTLDTLEGLDGQIDDKIISVAKMIVMLDHDAEGIKAVAKKQAERAKALEQKAAWLRDYLKNNMLRIDHLKVENAEISVKLANTPPAVKIIDENMIPEEFWRTKTEITVDKAGIKAAGGCPGAVIESGMSVRIK